MNKIFGVLIIAVLLLAGCGSKNEEIKVETETITIKDKIGEVTLKKNPKNIAVLGYEILDILDELNIDVVGVSKSSLPEYLKKYADDKYTDVGGLKEPNFEELAKLNLDVIFITGRQADLYDQLSEIAPTVLLTTIDGDFFGSLEKNFNVIGQIFDMTDKTDKMSNDIKVEIEKVKAKVSGNAMVVMSTGGKVTEFTKGSRFGIIFDELGYSPTSDIEAQTHGTEISFENILNTNPDTLFVVDRDKITGTESNVKEFIENDLIKKSNAYKNNKIVYLEPTNWYLISGGYTSTLNMLKEIDVILK